MTPEAEHSLEKADNCLAIAHAELAINLSSEAGRNAYLAAFHAARAFIFERTGKVVKRHETVHREFHRLAKDEPAIDKSFPPFLSQGLQHESDCRLQHHSRLFGLIRRRRYRD